MAFGVLRKGTKGLAMKAVRKKTMWKCSKFWGRGKGGRAFSHLNKCRHITWEKSCLYVFWSDLDRRVCPVLRGGGWTAIPLWWGLLLLWVILCRLYVPWPVMPVLCHGGIFSDGMLASVWVSQTLLSIWISVCYKGSCSRCVPKITIINFRASAPRLTHGELAVLSFGSASIELFWEQQLLVLRGAH